MEIPTIVGLSYVSFKTKSFYFLPLRSAVPITFERLFFRPVLKLLFLLFINKLTKLQNKIDLNEFFFEYVPHCLINNNNYQSINLSFVRYIGLIMYDNIWQ